MTNEPPPNDMRSLWQDQRTEPVKMSLDEIRKKAQKFQHRIRWRNLREYSAAVFVVGIFGFYIWHFHNLFHRIGSGLVIAGTLYVVSQLHKRGSARTAPTDMALTTCLDFHRRELERQRDLLRGIWSWYLGPLIPGLAVFTLGGATANPNHPLRAWTITALNAALAALVFFLIGALNQKAARKLQRQIDELDTVERHS
jgi:hypothetical protein